MPYELSIPISFFLVDTGSGISSKLKTRLFSKYVQGGFGALGTGLGLAISQALVLLHQSSCESFSVLLDSSQSLLLQCCFIHIISGLQIDLVLSTRFPRLGVPTSSSVQTCDLHHLLTTPAIQSSTVLPSETQDVMSSTVHRLQCLTSEVTIF